MHDAISDVKDAVIVGDHHNSDILCLGKVLENVGDGAAGGAIKGGGWFISKDEIGTRRQGSGNRDPLFLAAGELFGKGVNTIA
ncbi:MAG: hypothetical protein Fur0042_24620 [Cyanophyceae cyanobacterium]